VIRPYISGLWVRSVILGFLLIVCGLSVQADGETIDVAVLLQQTPLKGGTIIPDCGVHRFGLNTQVVLTAVPSPGYSFMYWLGEVVNPTSSRTIAYIDKPKIIVAVFDRSEYEIPEIAERGGGQTTGGSGRASRDGLRGSSVDFSAPQGAIGGSPSGKYSSYANGSDSDVPPVWPSDPTDDSPSEPDDSAVPEPTTVILLLAGSALSLPRHRTA